MDTEKQKQHRHGDVRLTKSRNGQFMGLTYRTARSIVPCIGNADRFINRRPVYKLVRFAIGPQHIHHLPKVLDALVHLWSKGRISLAA